MPAALLPARSPHPVPEAGAADESYVEPTLPEGLRGLSAAPASFTEGFVGAVLSTLGHGLIAALLLATLVKPLDGPVLEEIPVEVVVEPVAPVPADSAALEALPSQEPEAAAAVAADEAHAAAAEAEPAPAAPHPAPPDVLAEASPPVAPAEAPPIVAEPAPPAVADEAAPALRQPPETAARTPEQRPQRPVRSELVEAHSTEVARRAREPRRTAERQEASLEARARADKAQAAARQRAALEARARAEKAQAAAARRASVEARARGEKAQAAAKQRASLEARARAEKAQAAAGQRARLDARGPAGRPTRGTQRDEAPARSKGTGATASGAEAANYRAQVIAHLGRFKRYPPGAEARGAEGNPAVAFSLEGSGVVVTVSLARSSGHSDIDTEALAMVRRAVPFPAPPPGAPRSISATIGFQLR